MLQSKTQSQRRALIALALVLALCAAGIVPAAATTTTNTSLPVITGVQLALQSAGKISMNGLGFGSVDPPVKQSKSLSGSQIVFDRQTGTLPPDIYIMNADGSEVANITQHPAVDVEADWGP